MASACRPPTAAPAWRRWKRTPHSTLPPLPAHLKARLPAYARPLFLRLAPALAVTETFKQKKQDLLAEGFDPAKIEGPLYADLGDGYVPLDAALYARISSGLTRL